MHVIASGLAKLVAAGIVILNHCMQQKAADRVAYPKGGVWTEGHPFGLESARQAIVLTDDVQHFLQLLQARERIAGVQLAVDEVTLVVLTENYPPPLL